MAARCRRTISMYSRGHCRRSKSSRHCRKGSTVIIRRRRSPLHPTANTFTAPIAATTASQFFRLTGRTGNCPRSTGYQRKAVSRVRSAWTRRAIIFLSPTSTLIRSSYSMLIDQRYELERRYLPFRTNTRSESHDQSGMMMELLTLAG